MTDSILDEFDDERPAYRFPRDIRTQVGSIDYLRRRFPGGTCCGLTAKGTRCHRIGLIVRDNHSYCQDHDPGPEAA